MRFLQVVNDSKFVDCAIETWDRFPTVECEWVIVSSHRVKELQFVKKKDRVTCVILGTEKYKELCEQCKNGRFDVMIVHSFAPWWNVIAKESRPIPVVMIFWGFEIYLITNGRLYRPRTRTVKRLIRYRQIKHRNNFLGVIKHFVYRLREFILRNRFIPLSREYCLIKKNIDLICVLTTSERKWLANYFRDDIYQNICLYQYGYFLPSKGENMESQGDAIWLNNSADPSGNHIDILDAFAQLKVQNTIYCSLSYGDPAFRNFVVNYGRKLFGKQFVPITDSCSFGEYSKLISRCSYMIMGHQRQQAMGNIRIGVQYGLKIFLYKDSPLYNLYTSSGMIVTAIDDIEVEDFQIPLTHREKKTNSDILVKLAGVEELDRRISNLMSKIQELTGRVEC